MKLANIRNFHLTWMGIEEIKKTTAENSGKTRLPAASRIFLANQRRAGDETK